MSRIQKWVWEAYFILILFSTVGKAYDLFNPGSPDYLYFSILKSFDPAFYFAYGMYTMQVALNVLHCIPLLLYVYRINFLHPKVWQYLFILRCIFEVVGRSYESNTFEALYHSNPKLLVIVLIVVFVPSIPSYCACYQYAFKSRTR